MLKQIKLQFEQLVQAVETLWLRQFGGQPTLIPVRIETQQRRANCKRLADEDADF